MYKQLSFKMRLPHVLLQGAPFNINLITVMTLVRSFASVNHEMSLHHLLSRKTFRTHAALVLLYRQMDPNVPIQLTGCLETLSTIDIVTLVRPFPRVNSVVHL